MKKVLVLGATGSIGTSALKIIKKEEFGFSLVGATACKSKEKLRQIQSEFNLENEQVLLTSTFEGDGLKKLIENSSADVVVNGIAGAAGLRASQLVLECGIDLALANKETIVMAGNLIKDLAKKTGAKILPVDSEHSAIFDLCEKCGRENVAEIILTASGGPFRNLPREDLEKVTLEDALKHPTWKMGRKITIDSATLANKGLEVIEAKFLFDIDAEKIRVVVHPQSLVHSLVRANDGVLYAQISHADMQGPIFRALSWPKISPSPLEPLDLTSVGKLEFFPPRDKDFPMLPLAYSALKTGGAATIAYNAANEVAVEKFLNGKIKFLQISEIVEKVCAQNWKDAPRDFFDVENFDKSARKSAETFC